MANPNVTSNEASSTLIAVRITPVIEREYARRGVFPELRLANAARIMNGATGVHKVNIERADELAADASSMALRGHELPRGIPAAYSALARNVARATKEELRRGLWDDPGREEAERRAAQSPARFEVGDVALYFNDDNDGSTAEIVEKFDLYSVESKNGEYIDAKGRRNHWRPGYVVKFDGGDRYFVPAHRLTRDDCKVAHVVLAHSIAPLPSQRSGVKS